MLPVQWGLYHALLSQRWDRGELHVLQPHNGSPACPECQATGRGAPAFITDLAHSAVSSGDLSMTSALSRAQGCDLVCGKVIYMCVLGPCFPLFPSWVRGSLLTFTVGPRYRHHPRCWSEEQVSRTPPSSGKSEMTLTATHGVVISGSGKNLLHRACVSFAFLKKKEGKTASSSKKDASEIEVPISQEPQGTFKMINH